MVRVRKGGRPRKDGQHEPNGRLLRYPSGDLKPQTDLGTDELRWRKGIIGGTKSLKQVQKHRFQARDSKAEQRDDTDISPLGILVARRLITERQHDTVTRFLFLHVQVYRDAPKLKGNSTFTRAPSGSGKDDAEEAARR